MSLVQEMNHGFEARRVRRRERASEITDDRRIEWATAAVLAGFGFCLLLPGNKLAFSR